MQTLQDKLKSILQSDLRDGETDLETLPNGHVCGHVISSEFEGRDYEARRTRVREVFEKNVHSGKLTKEEYVQVGTLLTYTPAEWAVVTTDS